MNTFKRTTPIIFLMALLSMCKTSFSQTQDSTLFPAGSVIIDMGIVPQTIGNALKPYGMVYHLTMDHAVPVSWVIEPSKAKDGVDFTYNGYDFKGGPFIIPAQYLTQDVIDEIATWIPQGVVTVTTTSPLWLKVFKTLTVSNAPRWTMDKQNGSLAVPYFANAGIPPSAYGGSNTALWKLPSELTCCDDIFIMPHADPTWATHSNLMTWNDSCRGAIWLGCHAGSALEDMFNPADPSQQTNFLTEKSMQAVPPGIAPGPYYQNGLLLWTNHSAGTPPYTYDNGGDPVMQFMGPLDNAVLNGSEQIYIPTSGGWRPTTVVSCFDPDHPQRYNLSNDYKYKAAIIAYGHAYGISNRGMVMLEASHQLAKSTAPANVAAQRAFFNFSLIAARTTAPDPGFNVNLGNISSADTVPLSFTVSPPRNIQEFDIIWTSSCGGTFIPNNAQSVLYVAPQVSSQTYCTITIKLTEKSICQRVYKNSTFVQIFCNLKLTATVSPSCYGLNNGKITITNIIGGPAPYKWSWIKDGGGSDNGTGTTITGLAPGNYTVTLIADNGTGCVKTFTATITENPQLSVSTIPTNLLCNGISTGSITLSPSGGIPAYTYSWADGPTTQNRTGLAAGTYTVTVTDSKACTSTAQATITQPNGIVITPSVTPVLCNGNTTGAINLDVVGGTGAYTYAWADGPTSQNRTGLAAGNYTVTVTDANFCTQVLSNISVTQPTAITASASATPNPVLCNSGTTTITVTASGGTAPLQYSLNGGTYQLSNQFTDVSASASAYNITVKDANNCTKTTTVLVTQPAPLILSSAIIPETCPNDNDGVIDLIVNGGTTPYTYAWADLPGSPDPEDRTGLGDGSYSVTVTDVNGCTANITVVVNTANSDPSTPSNINN
ncbi:MAG: SprB repeat-containing protein [Bacteroidales bacterium]|nr:SprB repeat-containing protein [Bacteroidales bacterium]